MKVSSGFNPSFPRLSLCKRQVTHVLLTRPPLIQFVFCPKASVKSSSLDLHVLSAPPAFVLSQDQTLNYNLSNSKIISDYEFWFLCYLSITAFVILFLHYLIIIFLRYFLVACLLYILWFFLSRKIFIFFTFFWLFSSDACCLSRQLL